jgi:hypothetical protein
MNLHYCSVIVVGVSLYFLVLQYREFTRWFLKTPGTERRLKIFGVAVFQLILCRTFQTCHLFRFVMLISMSVTCRFFFVNLEIVDYEQNFMMLLKMSAIARFYIL